MRYVALLDTESTGLDLRKDRTIEVAVSLFDLAFAQPVVSFSSLIAGPASNEAFPFNGIPAEMLPDARESARVWGAVNWVIEPAEVIIAHHAEHDRQFCPDLGKPWVCSEEDITWPGSQKGGRAGSLTQLALSLGLGVASAHRALVDVDTLSRILTRLREQGHDITAMIQHGMRPKATFHALTSYDEREITKQNGFRWDPDKKIWWRRMAIDDAEKLPFRTRMVTT